VAEAPFEVEPALLREVSGLLTAQGYRLGHGLAGVPGLLVPAPGWSTGVALAEWETAVHRWCGRLGARVGETGLALATAADGYETVDQRAARRLTEVPR
jgi:hypothetical protein